MLSELYTSEKESQFFTKSEYDHIGYEFNFKALEELTNDPKFIEEIENNILYLYVKKFRYKENKDCFFFDFYCCNHNKENFIFIHAYHNKNSYFSINSINDSLFKNLDMNVKITNKKYQKEQKN